MEEQANIKIADDAANRISKKLRSRTFVGIGKPADKIVQKAEDEAAQLIVIARTVSLDGSGLYQAR